jgi:hypothetical protein
MKRYTHLVRVRGARVLQIMTERREQQRQPVNLLEQSLAQRAVQKEQKARVHHHERMPEAVKRIV